MHIYTTKLYKYAIFLINSSTRQLTACRRHAKLKFIILGQTAFARLLI